MDRRTAGAHLTPVPGPNVAMRATWGDAIAPSWVALADAIEAQYRPLGQLVLDRTDVHRGASVLDVGCGCGHTTIELAAHVDGPALGVDIAPLMIEEATRVAADRHVDVRFVVADAQVHHFAPATLDLVYSRFGLMFFADPLAAFVNLRAAMRPAAQLAFVCWGAAEDNEWNHEIRELANRFATLPPAPGPDEPGQHSLADPRRVRRLLDASGFDDVEVARIDTHMLVGGPGALLEDAVSLQLQIGPGRQLGVIDPAAVPAFAAALVPILESQRVPDGFATPVSVNVVTARAR